MPLIPSTPESDAALQRIRDAEVTGQHDRALQLRRELSFAHYARSGLPWSEAAARVDAETREFVIASTRVAAVRRWITENGETPLS